MGDWIVRRDEVVDIAVEGGKRGLEGGQETETETDRK